MQHMIFIAQNFTKFLISAVEHWHKLTQI